MSGAGLLVVSWGGGGGEGLGSDNYGADWDWIGMEEM